MPQWWRAQRASSAGPAWNGVNEVIM
jgi:hypothetical protein